MDNVFIEELCTDIFAHCELDWEITLSGNGTNPCEAGNVAYALLDELYKDGRKWRKQHQAKIALRMKELRKEMGE